jgi:hypothetical protein
MEKTKLIEIVITAVVAAIVKEVLASLIKHTKMLAVMLTPKILAWLQSHFRVVDGVMDFLQGVFQFSMTWWCSSVPPRPHQSFAVSLLVCAGFFYLFIGVLSLRHRD